MRERELQEPSLICMDVREEVLAPRFVPTQSCQALAAPADGPSLLAVCDHILPDMKEIEGKAHFIVPPTSCFNHLYTLSRGSLTVLFSFGPGSLTSLMDNLSMQCDSLF